MVDIKAAKRRDAVDRFVDLAGLPQETAEFLVDATLQAAVDQALDMIAGSDAVPSALTATRADELRYVCLKAGRILTQREVSVMFRTTPANAKAILTAMSATYQQALHDRFLEAMKNASTVSAAGNAQDGMGGVIASRQHNGC